ncbi:MAG: nucleoside phosphorylase [Trueperaceae bacterium]|nr:MAG: nucleoside phosphorylase [Trueperaceae bacterium]
MTDAPAVQRHIRAAPGDVAPYVLIPGDPGRAERIAEAFGSATLVARHREYVLYTGTTPAGTPISVCSTGIGGPSASIAVEELIRVGATHFIRVGSAGGRRPGLPIGSVVVVTGAFRGDGTSLDYMPLPFPAVADLDVTLALRHAAEAELGERALEGIVYTRDAFYRRDDGLNALLTASNVVAAEQECATVFVVGAVRGVKVGAVLGTDSNILLSEQPTQAEKEAIFQRAEATTIQIAMRAVDDLHAARRT